MYRVNVGGLGVPVAGVLLSLQASMFRIVKSDHKSPDGLSRFLYINQNTSAAICQPVQGVDVVDQDDLAANFELQDGLEWSVLDASSIVDVELPHSSARVPGLDGEHFSFYLLQLRVVSGIHLGVGPVDVEGVAVEGGVGLLAHSGLKKGDVLLCVDASSYPVQQIPVDLVIALSMILF